MAAAAAAEDGLRQPHTHTWDQNEKIQYFCDFF